VGAIKSQHPDVPIGGRRPFFIAEIALSESQASGRQMQIACSAAWGESPITPPTALIPRYGAPDTVNTGSFRPGQLSTKPSNPFVGGGMVDKAKDEDPSGDPGFQVSEAKNSSSPDFLTQEGDKPPEPEWHLKNMEKPPDLHMNSLAEVDLDDEPQVSQTDAGSSSGSTGAPPPKPDPVDLTPEETHTSTPPGENVTPERTTPLQPGQPQPGNIGLFDKPARPKEPPLPANLALPEETAYEKDLRRRMSATPPGSTSDLLDETNQTKVIGLAGPAVSDGKTLRFPGGTRFNDGDIIECNDRRYRVKIRTGYPSQFYLKAAGLLVLAVLAAVGLTSFLGGPPTGTISGVVIDSATGKIIPGAEVTLPDGTPTKTNLAGMYTFGHLTPGEYALHVSIPGYGRKSQTVTRLADNDVTLPFALTPLFASRGEEKEKKGETEKAGAAKKPVEYGTLKLNLDFGNYIIYFDDRIFGKNIKKISKIRPGKHRLTLEKNQYEEYRTDVEIKARRTTKLSISISDLKRKTTPRQRAKARFAEGKSALDNGHYQAAIKEFDVALAEISEYPEARQYRGWAYRKLGDMQHAAADLKAATELYALSNRYLEAVTCVNLLLEMYPHNGAFHLMRGNHHTALGELKSAIEDYKAAVNADKKSLPFRLALAEAHYQNKQFKEAAKVFEKARKMAGDPTDIYIRLILSYMYAGKDKDLIKRYYELVDVASEEKMERLRRDPEWQNVLQLIGPNEKFKNH